VKNWLNKKNRFLLCLTPEIDRYVAGKRAWSSRKKDTHMHWIRSAYVHILFRNKFMMDDTDAMNIYYSFIRHWPINLTRTQALIDKYLKAAAEEQGVSIGEIEDMEVDDTEW
jgi:hypothetical protein